MDIKSRVPNIQFIADMAFSLINLFGGKDYQMGEITMVVIHIVIAVVIIIVIHMVIKIIKIIIIIIGKVIIAMAIRLPYLSQPMINLNDNWQD